MAEGRAFENGSHAWAAESDREIWYQSGSTLKQRRYATGRGDSDKLRGASRWRFRRIRLLLGQLKSDGATGPNRVLASAALILECNCRTFIVHCSCMPLPEHHTWRFMPSTCQPSLPPAPPRRPRRPIPRKPTLLAPFQFLVPNQQQCVHRPSGGMKPCTHYTHHGCTLHKRCCGPTSI